MFGAVRDLLSGAQDGPPLRRARVEEVGSNRVPISTLLAEPPSCAACFDTLPIPPFFACHACMSAFCATCLAGYAAAALRDRSLLPLRCSSFDCRAPVPLSSIASLLGPDDVARLQDWQQQLLRPPPSVALDPACNLLSSSVIATGNSSHSQSNRDESASLTSGSSRLYASSSPLVMCDSEILRNLFEQKGWKRCPECGTGVERTFGCRHMVCVCGGEFCYQCGRKWSRGGISCPPRCNVVGIGMDGGFGDENMFDGNFALDEDNARNEELGQDVRTLVGGRVQPNTLPFVNLPARLFEGLRDQVWRRVVQLIQDLQAHARLEVHEHRRRVQCEQQSDAVCDRNQHNDATSETTTCPVPNDDAPAGRSTALHRLSVNNLVHVEEHSRRLSDQEHHISTRRSMKLSFIVLHNLDFLVNGDEDSLQEASKESE